MRRPARRRSGAAAPAHQAGGAQGAATYPATDGIGSTQIAALVSEHLRAARDVPELLPGGLRHAEGVSGVSAALTADFRDGANLTVPFTPLVIETGGRRVVIDTGNGEAAFQKSGGAVGQFHANLKAAGFDRGAIDAVVISHFHGDHVNGLLNPAGKPAFPNAEIHVPEAEWAYWMDDGAMSRAPAGRMQDQFRNVRRVFDGLDRKVTPYAWEREVLPGLTALGTPGHTPGHTSFLLASGSDSLFVQSDVTNVPVLFARHPGWHVMYDQDPAMAEATRRRVYDRIAAERTLLQGFHYPFPAAAHLERTADGYREVLVPWDPVPR